MRINDFLVLVAIVCVLTSCGSTHWVSYSDSVPQSFEKTSRFVGFTELGMEKEAFIVAYGEPVGKDLFRGEDGQLIETLLYVEMLEGGVLLKTRFSFEENILTEQRVESEATYQKELERLELQINSLQGAINTVRHQVLIK